jgi:D,D-heptose 1,7-bisphosphate phosphatase
MRHALFLDRDGTINYDPGYLKDTNLVKLYPYVGEGIKRLKKEFDFKVIVISNQAGIAYGIMTKDEVNAVNEKINLLLSEYDTSIDAFYYCPFHPDYNSVEESECRKPSPYMIVKASEEHNIELNRSYMVGDKSIDVLCALNAGVKSILVKHGNDNTEINILHYLKKKPNFVAANFKEACDFIVKDYSEVST